DPRPHAPVGPRPPPTARSMRRTPASAPALRSLAVPSLYRPWCCALLAMDVPSLVRRFGKLTPGASPTDPGRKPGVQNRPPGIPGLAPGVSRTSFLTVCPPETPPG